MRTIKTKNAVKDIKVMSKPIILSSRLKSRIAGVKEKADDTKTGRDTSPQGYAGDKIENAAKKFVQRLPNPAKKARENIGDFAENVNKLKKYTKDGKTAARETLKAVKQINKSAEILKNDAEKARKAADKAKKTLKETKKTLKETRKAGRKIIRDAKNKFNLQKRIIRKAAIGRVSGKSGGNVFAGNASNSSPLRPGNRAMSKTVGNSAKTVYNSAKTIKQNAKAAKKTTKGAIKTTRKTVKTAEKSAKMAVKTAQNTAKAAHKTAQMTAKAAKTAPKAVKLSLAAAKLTVKAALLMVKAAIAAVKSLVALIVAGGWIAVVIILVVGMIAFLVGSVFGIFFSREPNPQTGQTINSVLREIDAEYTAEINEIISSNPHDLLDMSGARAAWRHVLAIYAVRTVTDSENPMEVAIMTDEKAEILREVFWDMNAISFGLDTTKIEIEELDEDGIPTGETEIITQIVLRINVTHMTVQEAAELYGFSAEQRAWLEELLKPEYNHLWNMLLFGITTVGGSSILEVALTQLGNIGGEVYWRWYGFNSRVPWCAIFVSWVAEQLGFIEAGVFPKFAWCDNGIAWFQARGQWMGRDYIPNPGDIVFFDWNGDGISDHVGIVERVEGNNLHTVEGNTSDSVAQRVRQLNSPTIMGFGVVVY